MGGRQRDHTRPFVDERAASARLTSRRRDGKAAQSVIHSRSIGRIEVKRRHRLLYRVGITPWDAGHVSSEVAALADGPDALRQAARYTSLRSRLGRRRGRGRQRT
jgi:hypothetical protein